MSACGLGFCNPRHPGNQGAPSRDRIAYRSEAKGSGMGLPALPDLCYPDRLRIQRISRHNIAQASRQAADTPDEDSHQGITLAWL